MTVELSRQVSHALRHEPSRYGLELDGEGWVAIDLLVEALRRHERWSNLTVAEVEEMVVSATKQRHEISKGRIRARYGHSLRERLPYPVGEPPAILFHGTSRSAARVILAEGLRPMSRQYVHLAVDVETAQTVGRRWDPDPVVLAVDAAAAAQDGVTFFVGSETTWLADFIQPRWIAIPHPEESERLRRG